MNFNILFLAGGKKVSLARHFIKSGIKNKKKIVIYSYDIEKNPPISKFAKIIKGKYFSDPKIKNHIIKIIKKFKIKLVVSITDPSTIVLSELKKIKLDSCKICSDPFLNKILLNKSMTNKILHKNKILTTSHLKGYPIIAKPNTGSAASKHFLLYSAHQKKIFEKKNRDYIYEKYIKGKEYSVDVYINQKKEIIGMVCRERVEITGGESTIIISKKITELESLTSKIIKIFNITGPANVQFIKHRNRYYFMEINPRIAGGIMNTVYSGLDIPDIMIKEILNKKLKIFKFKKTKTIKYFEDHNANYN